jgi:predicted PurR-regulated permease PerM
MSEQQLKPDSAMRRASALFARIALAIVVVLLVGGLFGAGTQAYSASTPLFATACLLLILVPVVNVLSELVDEIARRDWAFAGAAAIVLLLILYTAISRIH